MKKIFLLLVLVTIFSSACYGASSEDVYVSKDVFDAKMEALFTRLDAKIDTAISNIKTEIAGVKSELGDVRAEIGKMQGELKLLDARLTNINNTVLWQIGGLTFFIVLLFFIVLILLVLTMSVS